MLAIATLLAAPASGLVGILITLLVILIIGGLIFWAVNRLSAAFGIPEPIRTVIIVVLGIIIVLVLVSLLLGGISLPNRFG